MSWEKDSKKFNDIQMQTIYCKCGHSIALNTEKTICTHCGKYAFKDKQKEFEYRLKEQILRSERNGNINERI